MMKKALLIGFCFGLLYSPRAEADGWFSAIKNAFRIGPQISKTAVSYGSDPEETAIVYRPPKPSSGASLTPAVILIHGGGWSPGATKENVEDYAYYLAKAGFTVINIDYRLARKDDSHSYWPAQLQDVQLAARWVKANAQALGIDPKFVCAVGGSAGGHLAMELGYQKQIQPGDRSEELKDQSPTVNCVVNICGPANIEHPSFVTLVQRDTYLMGKKTPQEAPAYWKSASPIHNIASDSAPTLLIQTDGDTLVTPQMGDELMSKLNEFHVPSERYNVVGGHIFIGTPEAEKMKAFAKMVQFLREHIAPSAGGASTPANP